MKTFSFARFVALLARVLEIGLIATLALRWLDAFLGIRYGALLPGSAVDFATNFGFLAIVCLLLADLWLLLTRQPRAVTAGLRTLVYIIVFIFSPYRLGGSPTQAAQRPNHAMELTASRRTI